jgi:FkbH-like protein
LYAETFVSRKTEEIMILKKHGFIISSTSNLLERNAAWSELLVEADLTFTEYGNISSAFFSDDDFGIISVIFLEDLLKDCLDDFTQVEKSIDALTHLVKSRALKNDHPIILCLASRSRSTPVSSAKHDTNLEIFHRKLIKHFTQLRDSFGSVYFLNLDHIFFKKGSEQIYSDRNWYFSSCRLSQVGLSILAQGLAQIVARTSKPRKKVLVLDCDNTLWGGVIGEDGLQGLILGQDGIGQAFVDFQKECLKLLKQGVLLAIASKNNEREVWNVFENHTSMVLKRKNIISSKINWKEKALNLTEIAAELGLGVDSLVFWDDNPIERSKVKAILPEVLVIEAPKNVIEWPYLINTLDCFSVFEVTSEDTRKVEQYRARADFVRDATYADDVASYLRSVNLKPELVPICEANIARAEQMCKKTNQFNVRSKRYTSAELASQNLNPNVDLFLVHLSDDYGDHGLIALFGIHFTPINVAFIDTFLLSCRVLGRKLESWILNEAIKLAKSRSVEHLCVDFIDTGRNSIARDFLVDHGFVQSKMSIQQLQLVNQGNLLKQEGELYKLLNIDTKLPNLEIYYGN